MSDTPHVARQLRERLGTGTEDRLGRALGELLESPILAGAIGRAFDAREKAAQAQEAALGALNLPSAADIERLTRRLRSVSQRLEGIEDGVGRLDRTLAPRDTVDGAELARRLDAIERSLASLSEKLDALAARAGAAGGAGEGAAGRRATARKASATARTNRPAGGVGPGSARTARKTAAVKAEQPRGAAGTRRGTGGGAGSARTEAPG